MFYTGRTPNHITGTDFLDRAAPTLRPAAASSYNQRLTKGVRMPCGAGAGLEGDADAKDTRRFGASNSGSMRTVPVKYSTGSRFVLFPLPLSLRCQARRAVGGCPGGC